MTSYKHKDTERGYEQAVDATPDTYGWNDWSIYPDYLVGEHEGRRFLYAPISEEQISGRRHYHPLSRTASSLFLEFARWPEEYGMDRKPLESDKNEDAALRWAQTFGVLGVDPPDLTVMGDSSEAIGFFLGAPGPDGFRDKGSRSLASGGPQETVVRFAGESWEANIVLRLYEAASNPNGPDVDAIVGFMPDQKDGWMNLPSIRGLHGKAPETARSWALGVVEETVERKVRGHCWPVPVRYGSSHNQGWAFDSLLGAMWLQMLWLMLGQPRRCEWCGKFLEADPELQTREGAAGDGGRKPRSDRRFCPSRGGIKNKCKADWNYHRGPGRSSKGARKMNRDRQRRAT